MIQVALLERLKQLARPAVHRVRPLLPPRPAILMYHRIADERLDPWGLAVSPSNFADQLDWIARRRIALPLVKFVKLNSQGKLPRNAVALTFDDGYACNAFAAAPLLERMRIPATIFLPTRLIERGGEFWWDELARIVFGHEGRSLRLDESEISLGEADPADMHWSPAEQPRNARQRAYSQLWSLLIGKSPDELESNMEQLRRQAQVAGEPRPTHRPLSVEDIREIQSDVVEFGSHAQTHASLTTLSTADKAREIGESLEDCRALTGERPQSFAYPYGHFDIECERLVQQAGFHCACKTNGGFVSRKSDRFALPRFFVGNWDARRLARVLGAA